MRCIWRWRAANSRSLHVSKTIAKKMKVAVGVIDVKSYYIETPEDVADADSECLAVCARGPVGVCAGLRFEPDGEVGGEAEIAVDGRRRCNSAKGDRRGMIRARIER